MSKNCIVFPVKHIPRAVIVWGSFGGEIAEEFIQINGIMWKKGWCNFLWLPHYLHQENYIIHSLKLYELSKIIGRYGILQSVICLCQSPDLPPIAIIWVEIDSEVRSEQPKNKQSVVFTFTHCLVITSTKIIKE